MTFTRLRRMPSADALLSHGRPHAPCLRATHGRLRGQDTHREALTRCCDRVGRVIDWKEIVNPTDGLASQVIKRPPHASGGGRQSRTTLVYTLREIVNRPDNFVFVPTVDGLRTHLCAYLCAGAPALICDQRSLDRPPLSACPRRSSLPSARLSHRACSRNLRGDCLERARCRRACRLRASRGRPPC